MNFSTEARQTRGTFNGVEIIDAGTAARIGLGFGVTLGLILTTETNGEHRTLVGEPGFVRMLEESSRLGEPFGLPITEETPIILETTGWPSEWATAPAWTEFE